MKEWKKYKLGEILTVKYGKDHKKLEDGPIPVYGSGGLMRFVNSYICDSPSILIPRKGSLNNVMYVEHPFWTVDTMFWTIIDTTVAVPRFVYYAICKIDFESLNVGSAVPSMTVPIIEDIEIHLPPLDEQKRIVKVLSSLESKIEVNRQINDNLEQQAQALYKSWFIDFEPFKDGKFVESGIGLIPEGWKVGTLSDLAEITMGQSPSGKSYNECGEGILFYQGRAEFGDRYPSIRLYTTEPSRIAEQNSVLLSVRAPVGDTNIAYNQCCIGRGLASIKAKHGFNSFIFYTVSALKDQFDMYNGEGTVFGSINKDSLSSMSVIVPPISIIRDYEKIVAPLDLKYKNLFTESTLLTKQRDALLPKLMSGELKINEIDC